MEMKPVDRLFLYAIVSVASSQKRCGYSTNVEKIGTDETMLAKSLLIHCPEEQRVMQERVYGILFLGKYITG